MKFELKNLKKVICVLTLISATQAHALVNIKQKASIALQKAAIKKQLAECIKAAQGKGQLLKELVIHEFTVLKNAFQHVKNKIQAWKAYRSLDPKNKQIVDIAFATPGVKEHFIKIIKKP